MHLDSAAILPVLKWPGGKRWLAPALAAFIREILNGTYFEPFLGGGAVFFSLRPSLATLSDVNGELIHTYQQIRGNAPALERELKLLPVDSKSYYAIRAAEPEDPFQRAVRFLYLNRTAYGGLYRLNAKGKFNVPYGGGRTPEILINRELLRTAAFALRGASLEALDFEQSISRAGVGDVIFCDPAYTVAHNKNAFVRYNEKNFSWADQIRLAHSAKAARERGATVLVTNAAHESVRRLYHPFKPIRLWRTNSMALGSHRPRRVDEYLFALLPADAISMRPRLINLVSALGGVK